MGNLRIIYDNAANRAAVTASTTAGSLAASNLLTDIKSQVWRATGTSATLTAIWTNAETVGSVALPFCNLTSGATIRVRGYTNAGDTTPIIDTGAVTACAGILPGLWGANSPGASLYSYGGGAYARVWFAPSLVKQLTIDLVDTGNAAGYVEASRLVVGNYWSPAYNAAPGASLLAQDTSTHYRNDSGDLMTNIGTRSRKIMLNLGYMEAADRASLTSIVLGNGLSKPVFFSLFPNDADSVLEQTHQIYGKLSSISAITIAQFSHYSAPLELEEI